MLRTSAIRAHQPLHEESRPYKDLICLEALLVNTHVRCITVCPENTSTSPGEGGPRFNYRSQDAGFCNQRLLSESSPFWPGSGRNDFFGMDRRMPLAVAYLRLPHSSLEGRTGRRA